MQPGYSSDAKTAAEKGDLRQGRDHQLLPEYDTESLFSGGKEIVIRHAGAEYRMKITRQGKLILNK